MPTTTVHSIGSGKDYSTVAAWLAAAPANLVTSDVIWKGEIYDELTVSGTTTLSGLTTDATRYLHLCAAASVSKCDDSSSALAYTTGKAGMTGSVGLYGVVLAISQDYTLVERLQFRSTNSTSSQVVDIAAKGVTVRKVVVDQTANSTGVNFGSTGGVVCNFVNSIVVMRGTAASAAVRVSSNENHNIINNTLVVVAGTTDYGINLAGGYSSPECHDNAIFGFGTLAMRDGSGRGFGASGHNATDAAALLGSGGSNLTSKTFANQFRDTSSGTTDLRPKTSGTDIAGAGNRQQTYTADLDFFDAARSTSSPTIGAVELVTSVSGRPMSYYARRRAMAA